MSYLTNKRLYYSKSTLYQKIRNLTESVIQYLTWMDICIQLGLYPRLSMAI